MSERPVSDGWTDMRRVAESHALLTSGWGSAGGAELIDAQTREFCGQGPPRDEDQLRARRCGADALASRVAAVSQSDMMTRLSPVTPVTICMLQ